MRSLTVKKTRNASHIRTKSLGERLSPFKRMSLSIIKEVNDKYRDIIGFKGSVEIFKKYNLTSIIGRGTFGTVFKAEKKDEPGKSIAIKVIPNILKGERMARSILREITIHRQLMELGGHKHFANLRDALIVEHENGTHQLFLVMDLEHENLNQLMKDSEPGDIS